MRFSLSIFSCYRAGPSTATSSMTVTRQLAANHLTRRWSERRTAVRFTFEMTSILPRRCIASGSCTLPSNVHINTADFIFSFNIVGGPSPSDQNRDDLSYALAIQRAPPNDRYIIDASGDGLVPQRGGHNYVILKN